VNFLKVANLFLGRHFLKMFKSFRSLIFVSSLVNFTSAISFSVDCNSGSDNQDGSPNAPFKTLMRARDAVRAVPRPLTPPGISVLVRGDCYPMESGSTNANFSLPAVLYLDNPSVDSGSSVDAPVVWTSDPAASSPARILAGAKIPTSAWKQIGQTGVFEVDLGPSGLDVAKYGFGSLSAGGMGTCTDSLMEFFWNGNAQTIARWPNINAANSTWQFVQIATVENENQQFSVNGSAAERANTWTNTPGWLHGFWSFGWADSFVEIAQIAANYPSSGYTTITVENTTAPQYGFLENADFYALNIKSELDAQGEYFIDTALNTLSFIPTGGDPTVGEAFLSLTQYGISSSSPFSTSDSTPIAGDDGVLSFVTFDTLSINYARSTAVSLGNAANINILNADVSNHGHHSISLSGTNHLIQRVSSTGSGCSASQVYGGNTLTIQSGNNSVLDSNFSYFGRMLITYEPALSWGGVGGTYARNVFSNGFHSGVLGSGVNNLFLNNTFDTLCTMTTDAGAWYSGRSWTNRGNVIEGNTFIRIRSTDRLHLGYPSVQAIYLDDELSGTVIRNNICIDSQTCWFVGGGRDVIVDSNVCKGVVDTCVHVDDRGLNWQSGECTYNTTFTGELVQQLFDVKYTQPPYSTYFPEIVNTLSRRPCTPVNISITDNSYCNATTKTFIDMSLAVLEKYDDYVQGNTPNLDC
jgi:hypothetical protein